MKNLTEGEKMVWAAVFTAEMGRGRHIVDAMRSAKGALDMLYHQIKQGEPCHELETAKEVLK